MQALIGAGAIVLMFLVLIVPHEGGHFLMAKLCKVRVIEFAVGMGPRLFGTGEAPAAAVLEGAGAKQAPPSGKTVYSWRLLPIAGYVRLGGMEPGDLDGPDGFHSKPAYQRLLILFGGPLANFVVAALLATTVYMMVISTPGKVGEVIPNRPAAAAGLHAGDVITQVDGTRITRPESIRSALAAKDGQPVVVTVRRPDGSTFSAQITPYYDDQVKAYLLGIRTQGTLATLGGQPILSPADALLGGVEFPVQAIGVIWSGIYQLVTGAVPGGVFGPQGATGPIGIGAITYSAAEQGILSWLYVAALLSVALGSANLLPLPALDGGRMVVVLVERVRGRPFDRERELAFQRVGLIALLALMGVIAFFDIQRLLTGQFPGLK